jgi:signal transduction histidine kinase
MNKHRLDFLRPQLFCLLQRALILYALFLPAIAYAQEEPCDTIYLRAKELLHTPELALAELQRIIPLEGTELKYDKCHVGAVYAIARLQLRLANNVEAIKALEKYVSFPEEVTDPKARDKSKSHIPDIYRQVGLYERSFEEHMNLIAYRDSTQDSIGLAKSYYELGKLFHDQGNHDRAIDYLQQSLELCTILGDTMRILSCYSALGTNNRKLGKLEEALAYNQVLDLIPKAGLHPRNKLHPYAEVNMGSLLLSMGKLEEAAIHMEKGIELTKKIAYKPGLVTAYLDYGRLFELQGANYKALKVFQEGLAIAEELKAVAQQGEFHQCLSKLYYTINKVDDAYLHLSVYSDLKDSIINQEQQKRMAQVGFKYELEKNAREIVFLNQEVDLLQKKKIIDRRFLLFYIASFILVLCLLGLFVYWYRRQKAHNAILQEKNEKINEQNDLLSHLNAELKQFASIASHDMREPLRSIGAFSSLLSRQHGKKLDQSGKDYLNFINEAVRRMTALLTDLLDYSKINSQQAAEWIDLKGILQTVVSNLHYQIMTKEGKVEINRKAIPLVKAVPTQMMQLFQNLISNALKFRKEDMPPVVTIDGYAQEGGYVLVVRDNGIGIDPAYKEKVFGMFNRLNNKDKFEGTGIGLATCKKIVQQHGGKIWVESEEGVGSAFHIYMPKKAVTFSQKKVLSSVS